MKTTHITQFIFGEAKYLTIDHKGNKVVLMVDYFKNKFEVLGEDVPTDTLRELEIIAKDLLRRKHQKNFADNTSTKL